MSNLVGEVHDHRSVEPRPIAIVFSVHLRGFVGVRKLKKSAVRTPDELKRTARNLVLNAPWEHPSQRLVAETQHRNHIRATADPAAIDPSVTLHLGISYRWHFATPFLHLSRTRCFMQQLRYRVSGPVPPPRVGASC